MTPLPDDLPYWMQALTDDERADLDDICRRVVFGQIDPTSPEYKAMTLVNRLSSLLHEIEETPTIDAIDGGPQGDDDEFDDE